MFLCWGQRNCFEYSTGPACLPKSMGAERETNQVTKCVGKKVEDKNKSSSNRGVSKKKTMKNKKMKNTKKKQKRNIQTFMIQVSMKYQVLQTASLSLLASKQSCRKRRMKNKSICYFFASSSLNLNAPK